MLREEHLTVEVETLADVVAFYNKGGGKNEFAKNKTATSDASKRRGAMRDVFSISSSPFM